MPDRPLPRDTREARAGSSRFGDNYIILGIVFVCVLMALVLLGAGMFDTGEKSTTQPSSQAPVTTQSDSQAPAITQPSTQAPATGETKTP
jgi:hypothetical protein